MKNVGFQLSFKRKLNWVRDLLFQMPKSAEKRDFEQDCGESHGDQISMSWAKGSSELVNICQ